MQWFGFREEFSEGIMLVWHHLYCWTQTKCQRYLREYLLPYVCLHGLKFVRHSVFKLTGKHQKTISPFHPRNVAKTIVVFCTRQEKTRRIVNVFVIRPFLSTRSWTGLALEMRKQESFSVRFLIYYLSESMLLFSNSRSLHNFMSLYILHSRASFSEMIMSTDGC